MNVTVEHYRIFGRSARLRRSGYSAPVRLPESAAILEGYRVERERDVKLVPRKRKYK